MTTASQTRRISYIQAVNEALRQEMERDPSVIIMGEDIAGGAGRPDKEDAWGGPMRLTKGLIGQFGSTRVRDTPISEAGFVGAGVGAAATGLRPVVDLMFVGFFGVCADQIVNNAAKIHYMFGGKVRVPLTIMTGIGAGTNSAAQHSETLYSVFTHFPGLKCVVPSNPYNAKGLFVSAIRDDDPVIIFNNRQLLGRRFRRGRSGGGLRGPNRQRVDSQGGNGRYARRYWLHDGRVPGSGAGPGVEGLLRRGDRLAVPVSDGRRGHRRVGQEDAKDSRRR